MNNKLKLAYFSVLKALGDACYENKGNRTFQSTKYLHVMIGGKVSENMVGKAIKELVVRNMIKRTDGVNYLPIDFETITFKPKTDKRQDIIRYLELTEKGWKKFYEINRKLA